MSDLATTLRAIAAHMSIDVSSGGRWRRCFPHGWQMLDSHGRQHLVAGLEGVSGRVVVQGVQHVRDGAEAARRTLEAIEAGAYVRPVANLPR